MLRHKHGAGCSGESPSRWEQLFSVCVDGCPMPQVIDKLDIKGNYKRQLTISMGNDTCE